MPVSIDKNVAYWGDRCCVAEAEVERLQDEIERLRAIIDAVQQGSQEPRVNRHSVARPETNP